MFNNNVFHLSKYISVWMFDRSVWWCCCRCYSSTLRILWLCCWFVRKTFTTSQWQWQRQKQKHQQEQRNRIQCGNNSNSNGHTNSQLATYGYGYGYGHGISNINESQQRQRHRRRAPFLSRGYCRQLRLCFVYERSKTESVVCLSRSFSLRGLSLKWQRQEQKQGKGRSISRRWLCLLYQKKKKKFKYALPWVTGFPRNRGHRENMGYVEIDGRIGSKSEFPES